MHHLVLDGLWMRPTPILSSMSANYSLTKFDPPALLLSSSVILVIVLVVLHRRPSLSFGT